MKHLLASGREVDINKKDTNGKTSLDIAREIGNEENGDESEDFENRKRNCLKIVELIESFERNQNETRIKLRIELGFAGKFIYLFIIYLFILLLYYFSITFFQSFFLYLVGTDAASIYAMIVPFRSIF